MQHLAQHGFPSATPIADRGGRLLGDLRGKPAAIVSFLTGISVRRPSPMDHCREAGAGLAWLHQAGAGFARRRSNDLGHGALVSPLRPAARREAEAMKPGAGAGDHRRRHCSMAAACAPRLAGERDPRRLLSPTMCSSAKAASRPRSTSTSPPGMRWPTTSASRSTPGASSPTAASTTSPPRAAFVAGYESRRPLSPSERAALPVLAHGAALRFFLTRLPRLALDAGRAALVKPKDPMEYERKLAVRRRCGVTLFEALPCRRQRRSGTPKVVIYTDGACRGIRARSGWGAVLMFGEREREDLGRARRPPPTTAWS